MVNLLARMDAAKGMWHVVARLGGLPYRTVRKVGTGETPNPTMSTVEAIDKGLRALAARIDGSAPAPANEAVPA